MAKADPECSVEDIIITYGDTLADKLPTGYTWGTEVDTTKQYKVVEGGYNFTATYTPADTDNYNVVSDIPVKVIVKKATPNVTVPTGLEGYEGQPLSSVTLPSYAEGTFTWKDATKILEGTTDEAIAIYIPTDENYTTVEVPVSVTVIRNTVQSIEITKLPNNEYFEGAMFNPDGMEVIATYGYGAPQPVENYTYEIVDENGNVLTEPLTTNAKKVRVTYEGKTAEKEITVKEDYVTSISVAAPNKDYTYGDTIDLTNVTISKVWASGLSHGADDKEAVILDMISCTGIDENGKITNTGTLTVTVTYTNEKGDKLTDTFDIVVEDTIVNITMSDIETSYFVGDEIDPTLAITVDYGVKADETIPVQASWIKGIDMSKPGTYTLTIAYGDDDSLYPTKQITVKDFASKIEVNKETVIYKIGATVDFAKDVLVNKYMASDTSKAQTLTSGYTMSPATVDTTVATTAPITVTVSYVNEKGITLTDSFTVQVINATSGASIEKLPEMPTKLGDELVLDGGMVKVTKQDGSSIEIPMTDPSIKIAPAYNKNTQNKQELSLTYTYTELDENGNQVSNTIPVEGKLVIELKDWWTGKIVAQGIPTTSILGEDLDLTNATVSKVMYSGEHAETTPVTGAMISGFDKNVEGPQTVVVTYYGKETSVVVNVTDKTTGISMNTNPDKTEYTQGENIDVTGATLNVTKASGIKVIPITKEMISGYDPSKKGQQVVTVTYEGFTAEFIVNVKPGENKPVTPEKPGTSKPTNPTKPNTEEIATYTVTFVNYDGTVIKTEKVAKGKSATAPEMEERVGYKFLGWSKEFDNVEEDLTVMAEYEEIVRAKVNAPDNIVIEKGEELDPEGITIEIFDEDGEKTDEVPVTIDMISGFDPEKVGTQEVTVTYVDEDGYEYTATFKVKVVRPVETLGVKDEVQEDEGNSLVLPIVAGTGISAVLLFLIAWMTRKNVEIYALTENERKLIGKQKISKNDTRIVLDEYENELENANIEIVLNKKITSKLDQEMVDVVFKGKKATYKVVSEDNKEFSIKMKNN